MMSGGGNRLNLEMKITNRQARIGIIGMGYVGLPLGIEFARASFSVTGIDLSEEKVRALNNGVCYISGIDGIQDIVAKGLFRATTDFSVIRELDAVCIC